MVALPSGEVRRIAAPPKCTAHCTLAAAAVTRKVGKSVRPAGGPLEVAGHRPGPAAVVRRAGPVVSSWDRTSLRTPHETFQGLHAVTTGLVPRDGRRRTGPRPAGRRRRLGARDR